jgi:hypothetical protein
MDNDEVEIGEVVDLSGNDRSTITNNSGSVNGNNTNTNLNESINSLNTKKNNTPTNNAPKNNTPKNNTSKNNTSTNNTPKNNTPKNNSSTNNTPTKNAPKNNGNGDLNAKIQEIQPLLTKISELKASYTNAETARKEEMKTEFEDIKAKIIALQEEINGLLTEMTIETNVLTFFQESYPEYMESLQKLNVLENSKKNMGALVSTNNNQQIAAANNQRANNQKVNTQQVNNQVNVGKNENGGNNQTNAAANNQNRPKNQNNAVANNQTNAPTNGNKNAITPNNKNKNVTTPNNKNKNSTTTARANNAKNNAVTGGKRKTRKLNKRK